MISLLLSVRQTTFVSNHILDLLFADSHPMTFSEFSDLVARGIPPPADLELLYALWADRRGDWDQAHTIVQGIDGREGACVHAYLHRKEGDLSNARYWYVRAGSEECRLSLDAEWEDLVRQFL